MTAVTEQTRRAAIAVADRAKNADDCRQLLEALGLVEPQPKRRGRPPVDHGHGHPATYQKGCRCDDCREANRNRCAEDRKARTGDPAAADRAGHGKASTYRNYNCRCSKCSKANTANVNAYRARKRQGAAA